MIPCQPTVNQKLNTWRCRFRVERKPQTGSRGVGSGRIHLAREDGVDTFDRRETCTPSFVVGAVLDGCTRLQACDHQGAVAGDLVSTRTRYCACVVFQGKNGRSSLVFQPEIERCRDGYIASQVGLANQQ